MGINDMKKNTQKIIHKSCRPVGRHLVSSHRRSTHSSLGAIMSRQYNEYERSELKEFEKKVLEKATSLCSKP